jgi:hypothetical protein
MRLGLARKRLVVLLLMLLSIGISACSRHDPSADGHGSTAKVKPHEEAAFQGPDGYFGHLDHADCDKITGWAWNCEKPDTAIEIELFDGEKQFAIVTADQYRHDLTQGGMGNGRHAFSYPTPASLKDGKPHTIRAVCAQTDVELQKSPRTLNCPSEASTGAAGNKK